MQVNINRSNGEINRYQNVQVGTLLMINTLIATAKGDVRSKKVNVINHKSPQRR